MRILTPVLAAAVLFGGASFAMSQDAMSKDHKMGGMAANMPTACAGDWDPARGLRDA
jgi:hypothetical protein